MRGRRPDPARAVMTARRPVATRAALTPGLSGSNAAALSRILLGATISVVAAGLVFALTGCGAVWTYGSAMKMHRDYYNFRFEPPDSVAFALPELPPVYAVVFQADYYLPPPEPLVLSRPIQPGIPADSVKVEIAFADTTGEDSVFVGPILDLGPPPLVRVDLTPAQEAALRARAANDIAQADRLLDELASAGGDAPADRERVEAARGLLVQAGTALTREDYQGAANLAEKARLIAENLAASRP